MKGAIKNWWNNSSIPNKVLSTLGVVIIVFVIVATIVGYGDPLSSPKDAAIVEEALEKVDSGDVSNITFGPLDEVVLDNKVMDCQFVYYTLTKDSVDYNCNKVVKVKKGLLKYKYDGLLKLAEDTVNNK